MEPALDVKERRSKVRDAAALADPIDRVHLARYTLGNLALEIEVLGLFAEQAPRTLAALRSARTDKAWRDAAHTLKGSARAVGAWHVAAAAESAERLPLRPEGAMRNRLIAEVAVALETAIAYCDSLKSRA